MIFITGNYNYDEQSLNVIGSQCILQDRQIQYSVCTRTSVLRKGWAMPDYHYTSISVLMLGSGVGMPEFKPGSI